MKVGEKKEWHVHLYSSDEEDWVTVSRVATGYYFAIEPKRETRRYRGGPFENERQASAAAKKYMRENWKQWWDPKTGRAA
jgi:hypothetical protein